MKKRVLSALLAMCLVLGLSSATALAADESAAGVQLVAVAESDGAAGIQPLAVEPSAVSPVITLAGADACRYHHGDNLGSITPGSWDGTGRGSYDGGTATVTNSGGSATVYFKERAHFKNADYLLQPFTLSVEVPAYTTYVVTFDVDLSMARNAKGSTWCFLEMADNTDNAAYSATFSSGANTNMAAGSRFRAHSDANSYSPSLQVDVDFTNETGAAATVTRQYAFLIGNSKSSSLLTSYHHQLETTVKFTASSVTAAKTITYYYSEGNYWGYERYIDDSVTLVTPPVSKYYTFTGWKDTVTGRIYDAGETYSGASGLTMVGQWAPTICDVTLEPNGGTVETTSATVIAGEPYGSLPTPAREGYTFLGWYTAQTGGSRIAGTTTVTNISDHTLYAHWRRNTVTATFNANGGSPSSSRVINAGDALGDLPAPTRTGYTFDGWYTEKEGGTQITATNAPTASATYCAHWKANTYKVTLDANGGTVTDNTISVTYDGTYGTLPEPTRENYTFTGWYTAQTGGERVDSDTAMTRTADHTLYARWSRITYAVTFDADGGSAVANRTVNAGDALGTLPTPTRAGYTFDGWYNSDNEEIRADAVPVGDVTYTAQWAIITYTIPVDDESKPITVERPYSSILPETVPPKDGYTFSGWQDEKGNTINPNAKPNSDSIPAAINPKWTANSYAVTFDAGSGTLDGSSSRTVTYGQPYGALPVPTMEDYNFVGWKLGNATVTASTVVTTAGDHTLTAQFELQHKHSVSHDGQEIEFETELTQEMIDNESGAYYTLDSGSYYLTKDIETEKQIRIAEGAEVNLCFNGYTITSNYDNSIFSTSDNTPITGAVDIRSDATLNTCDCQGNGGITSDTTHTINVLGSSGTKHYINLYGGTFAGSGSYDTIMTGWAAELTVDGATITSTNDIAIYVNGAVTAKIKSGTVTTSKDGGGTTSSYAICIKSPNFTMTGGTVTNTGNDTGTYGLYFYPDDAVHAGGKISGGTISANRYGIYVGQYADVTLSDSPVITGGQAAIFFYYNGGDSGTVTVGDDLTGTYSVYYRNYSSGGITEAAPRTITTEASEDYSSHFTAASSMKGVEVRDMEETNGQHVVQLYMYHRHDGVEYTALTADSTTSLISGYYFLAEDLEKNITIPEGETVDLCLNGKTLTGQITVNGTLNLYDCQGGGKVVNNSGSAIVGVLNSVVNYYGGKLDGGSGDNVSLYTDGVVNLYATPSITTSCDYDIRGNSEGFLHICAKLTKPGTPLKVGFGSDSEVDITNKKQVTITTGWSAVMGSTADPAEYLACRDNRYAKVVKGDNGEAVLRLFQVTIDGEVCYPGYTTGTLSTVPGQPTRTGYIFDGWYTAETGGTQFTDLTTSHMFTDDATLYSHWTECDHSGHSGDKTSQPATCTEPGYEKFTCSLCGAEVETAIPALGHAFDESKWETDETNGTHYHICGNGCGVHEAEAPHIWDDGVTENGVITYTCTACGTTETEAAPPAPTYSVTYRLDEYTVGDTPTQADAAEGDRFTLPSGGLTRTGYDLAGWLLLDENGLPGDTALTGNFAMPGRTVTFQVSWEREASYSLQDGDTVALEDGTVIHRDGGAVTIDQGGDGTADTTITLPENAAPVLKQGGEDEKDKITIPKGTEVTTGDGPTVTLGTGGGTVDTTGAVDAPVGSTVEDENGNKTTITGGTGTVKPDGVITFPDGRDGKIAVEDADGNKNEVTVPGGGDGAEVTSGGTVLIGGGDEDDGTLTIFGSDGSETTITLPDGWEDDGAYIDADEDTGAVTVPSGSTVEDENGNKTTIGGGTGTVNPDGTVTAPAGSTVEDGNGNTTTITEGTGTVNPDGTITFPNGGKLLVEDSEGNVTEVTVNPGGAADPEDPNPPSGGGGSGGSSFTPIYRPIVEQPGEGGSAPAVSPGNPKRGDKVTITPRPDPGYGVESITVTDRNGNPVAVKANPDGTYSFTQPSGRVTVSIAYRETGAVCDGGIYCPSRAFTDLSITAWYHEATDFVLANGIMNGYVGGTFHPNSTLSRAMLCQILYNLEGRPTVSVGGAFSDVPATAWCADAVAWANANGIVTGYGDGTFRPNNLITREQLAAMLWRYAGSPESDHTLERFTDAGQISGYARTALAWANETGVVNGFGDGTANPRGTATRAQTAQMVMNFLEN